MKPFLEHIDTGERSSIRVTSYSQRMIDVPLHYHPEHEMVYVQYGRGKLLLAEFEENFEKGDLFFIRGSVPHLFEDADLNAGPGRTSKVVVIQYRQSLFESLYHLPEFYLLNRLETSWGYGIKVKASVGMQKLINDLEGSEGLERFNKLLSLLNEMMRHKKRSLLGSLESAPTQNHVAYLRLQKMHAFLAGYFSGEITVDEVAKLMQMSKTGFCRFLRRETGKTFSEYLNYYRIRHACYLLRHSTDSILQICYSCGYNNAAYFFRQFKKEKNSSPLEYRRMID